jgi:hypothetical protein
MSRTRTGSLERGPDGVFKVRVTVTKPDGSTSRPWYSLGTTDEGTAKRRCAAVLADLAEGKAPTTDTGERVKEYAPGWLDKRQARGVGMWDDEKRLLEHWVLPELGPLPLGDVRPIHVRGILDSVVAAGKSRQTVVHVRAVMSRMFGEAWRDELIKENPAARVCTPPIKSGRVSLFDGHAQSLQNKHIRLRRFVLTWLRERAFNELKTLDNRR